MKYCSLIILLFLFSCGNKETVLLPKSNATIVADVKDHSPIYIFFRTKGKDTLAEVNRNNSISSTNGIFNIDKRLPLKLVIPEVMKLQEKKRNSAHKNELAENYYSYADSIGRNMAFLPFTKVYYKMEKPKFGVIVYFGKDNKILVHRPYDKMNRVLNKEDLQRYLDILPSDKPNKYSFCFSKNLSFGNYIQNKIFVQSLKFPVPDLNMTNEEFVY
jgi:hypothetical protein